MAQRGQDLLPRVRRPCKSMGKDFFERLCYVLCEPHLALLAMGLLKGVFLRHAIVKIASLLLGWLREAKMRVLNFSFFGSFG